MSISVCIYQIYSHSITLGNLFIIYKSEILFRIISIFLKVQDNIHFNKIHLLIISPEMLYEVFLIN